MIDAVRFKGQSAGPRMDDRRTERRDQGHWRGRHPGRRIPGELIGDIVVNELMLPPHLRKDDHPVPGAIQSRRHGRLPGWVAVHIGHRLQLPRARRCQRRVYRCGKERRGVARRYPNLTAANCVGDFLNSLSGRGEIVILSPGPKRSAAWTRAVWETAWVEEPLE